MNMQCLQIPLRIGKKTCYNLENFGKKTPRDSQCFIIKLQNFSTAINHVIWHRRHKRVSPVNGARKRDRIDSDLIKKLILFIVIHHLCIFWSGREGVRVQKNNIIVLYQLSRHCLNIFPANLQCQTGRPNTKNFEGVYKGCSEYHSVEINCPEVGCIGEGRGHHGIEEKICVTTLHKEGEFCVKFREGRKCRIINSWGV